MSFKIIAKNKKAFHEYEIMFKVEAGVVLCGTEVKSLREGKGKISEAYVTIDSHGEAFVYGMAIPQYSFGSYSNHVEDRKRKLLLHRHQIAEISLKIRESGMALIPLSLYFKDSLVKMEIGLGRGKKRYDKRQNEIKKEFVREMRESLHK